VNVNVSNNMYDVVVVGAGPCGSAAARCCAEKGLKTLIIEEHATIGSPVQCAGLLSLAAFHECGISDGSIIHVVRGARIVSGLGSQVFFDAKEPKAYVVDRGMLDREMAEKAVNAGADIRLKTSACGIDGHQLITRGVFGRNRVSFRILIAADGPRSSIARMLGMERSPVYLSGLQAEVPHEMDPGYVELYPDASPEFFGWVIPAGPGRARVGLCGNRDVKTHFLSFMERFDPRYVHLVTGTLPLGIMPRTYGYRTLFVGDAAGFAKPTSGGGIYTGVRSAKHAAKIAARCCDKNSFTNRDLRAYQDRWYHDFGSELAFGCQLFRMRQQLTPSRIDEICKIFGDPDIIEEIVKFGDMDRPSVLLRHLLGNPVILRKIGGCIRSELLKRITS
jgi:digeranylgeranylglycerophospholipid reductase